MDLLEKNKVEQLATNIRIDILKMMISAKAGHVGGSMSIVELLSLLYGKWMSFDPHNPKWEARDRLVLSKGHAGPALYSTLANVGFFEKEMLLTLNEGGTRLPSHPDRNKTPGVDMTTGSLGQGTSVAAGIATGLKLKGSDNRVYLIVGDGELNEGQCWESFQYMAHNRLNNCIVFIDDNKKQNDNETKNIIKQYDISKKMEAFGFKTFSVKGNDIEAIDNVITQAMKINDSAVAIVLDTIKGQGIPYFEIMHNNHSIKFDDEVIEKTKEIIEELEESLEGGVKHD